MMAHFGLVYFTCLVAAMLWISDSYGYKGVEVENGVTLRGKVTLKGPVPEPRAFPLVLYPFWGRKKDCSNDLSHA